MTTTQLLWSNRPPMLVVPGPNLTSAKLHEQSYPPQVLQLSSLVKHSRWNTSWCILYLGIESSGFQTPCKCSASCYNIPFPVFSPSACCASLEGHKADLLPLSGGGHLPFCNLFRFISKHGFTPAESAVHDGGGCPSPSTKPSTPGMHPLRGKLLFGTIYLADLIFLGLENCLLGPLQVLRLCTFLLLAQSLPHFFSFAVSNHIFSKAHNRVWLAPL